MTYRAELINEDTLEVVKVAYGSTKQEALDSVGYDFNRKGFDANVRKETGSQLSGCGVHSLYVD
jgi:hypothetical protein